MPASRVVTSTWQRGRGRRKPWASRAFQTSSSTNRTALSRSNCRSTPSLASWFRRAPGAQVPGHVALKLCQVGLLANGDPEDAIGIGATNLAVAGQRRGQHRLADAAHALHAHAGVSPVMTTGFCRSISRAFLTRRSSSGLARKCGGRLGTPNSPPSGGSGRFRLSTSFVTWAGYSASLRKSSQCNKLSSPGHNGVVTLSQDGNDGLVEFQSKLPLLAHVSRMAAFGPATYTSRSRLRIASLISWWNVSCREGIDTRSNQTSNPRLGEIIVQTADKGFVVTAGVREEDGGHRGALPANRFLLIIRIPSAARDCQSPRSRDSPHCYASPEKPSFSESTRSAFVGTTNSAPQSSEIAILDIKSLESRGR